MQDKDVTAAEIVAGATKPQKHRLQHFSVRLVKGKSRLYPVTKIGTFADLVKIAQMELAHLPHEEVIAIGLDGKNQPIGVVKVSQGGVATTYLGPADIMRPLIAMGALAFVIAHNHPSGDPTPSQPDIDMTRALAAAAKCVGITLLDHVIVGGVRGGGASTLREFMAW